MLKRILHALLWLGITALANAEPQPEIMMIKPEMAAQFSLSRQDINYHGRQYRLFIAAPKHHSEKLPVLYLLDGNAQFPMAVNLQNFSKKRPLVVAIGYVSDQAYDVEQRTRDYTYPADGEAFKNGGGAAEFLEFIRHEVKPYIERNYDVDLTRQHLFGHSFGGLFGLYVLFNRPELFNGYTLASPSLWWGDAAILSKPSPWLTTPPKQICIVLGEYEESPQNDPNITPERLAKVQSRQTVYPARQLATQLNEQGYPAEFILIPQKDHGGVISEALRLAIEKMP